MPCFAFDFKAQNRVSHRGTSISTIHFWVITLIKTVYRIPFSEKLWRYFAFGYEDDLQAYKDGFS